MTEEKKQRKQRKNNKKKKRHIGLIVFLSIAVLLTAGAIGYYRYFGSAAYVVGVEDMNNTWLLESESTEGVISDAATQNIYVDMTDVIETVFVSEGDPVEIGTPLIQYDTEALRGALEEAELSVEAARNKLEYEKKRLELDKKIVPVEPSPEPESILEENVFFDPETGEEIPGDFTEQETLSEPENTGITYTKEEKEQKIKDQEIAVKRAENSLRKAEANLTDANNKLGSSLITATMAGTIQHVGDPEHIDPTVPFITVQDENGLAVTGYISELNLSEKKVGDTITISSWETGNSATATITEISQYPDPNGNQWTEGNSNVSWYPYTAYISDSDGFTTGEYVGITGEEPDTENAIVIQKVYVRNEDGKNFVYVDNGSGRLVRREVKFERTREADYLKITEGLSLSDMIAFPYGSKAKEGIKTTTTPPLTFFF